MDIVERLKSSEVFITHGQMISPVAYEAADQITRLRVDNERLTDDFNSLSERYWKFAPRYDRLLITLFKIREIMTVNDSMCEISMDDIPRIYELVQDALKETE
jgi:predicted nuclease with TOPRIM domain